MKQITRQYTIIKSNYRKGLISQNFARNVLSGLSKKQKAIASKYFYDARGDKIFERIMKLKEYYPTRCELEILENFKDAIADFLPYQRFNLIDLGPGDGSKSEILINHFLKKGLRFDYVPIDTIVHFHAGNSFRINPRNEIGISRNPMSNFTFFLSKCREN